MSTPYRARKRFGQNFLTDTSVIDRIILSINPHEKDLIVEIGPGLGALTCPLLNLLGELHVIELDRDIIPRLKQRCGEQGKLIVHNVDVLKFDFSTLASEKHQLRVCGNLPYNISTPIIFALSEYADLLRDLHFMLQKEVVERLAATPGTSDYGRLSVMAQYHFKIDPLFLVPATAFDPQPKVESAIVRLIPHRQPPADVGNFDTFSKLVSQAFSQRRKTLKNVLKNLCDEKLMLSLDINPGARAEELSLVQYAQLSAALSR